MRSIAMRQNFHRFDGASLEDRFWAKVQKCSDSDCWPWLGTKDARGYGMFNVGKRLGRKSLMMRAHRVSLELKLGRELRADEESCHKCNNPTCVNPDHLYAGDHFDNMQDLSRSGKVTGENHAQAKVTDAQVLEMQHHRKNGKPVKMIAQMYGVSNSHASRLTRGFRRAA